MSQECQITVRFHAPPVDLRRFFTTFYETEITVPAGAVVRDALQPEWGNLRFFNGAQPISAIAGQPPLANARFTASGPTSRCVQFELGTTRFWGIGLLPLGWATFVNQPAGQFANLLLDGEQHPAFANFQPLADHIFARHHNSGRELAGIADYFRARAKVPHRDEPRIHAIHAALINLDTVTVADMARRIGVGQRTVERLCQRHFGFSPKLLLRRQRFMRSLSQFMLDPTLKWIGAMDSHYHDQAQFVRDFHEFMGLSPREYAAQPHPVLEQFMRERARMAGAAVQTLDRPEGVAPPQVAASRPAP